MHRDIFFVCNQQDTTCDFYKVLEIMSFNKFRFLRLVRNIYKKRRYHILDEHHDETFQKFATKSKIINPNPSKLVFLGYKEKSLRGIKSAKGRWYIGSKWFDLKNKDCVGVFFVSNGAQMLAKTPEWPNKFNKWVSFTDAFDPLTDVEIPKTELANLYDNVFEIIFKYDESKAIKDGLENVYHQAFEQVSIKHQNVNGFMAGYKLNFNKTSLACYPQ